MEPGGASAHWQPGLERDTNPMRIFAFAVLAAIILAAFSSITLNSMQKTSAQAYHTDAVRLDQQEAVNAIGRQG
jgi:type IV secretory pathway VirB10-like protein